MRGAGGTDGGKWAFLLGLIMRCSGFYLLLNAIVIRSNVDFGARLSHQINWHVETARTVPTTSPLNHPKHHKLLITPNRPAVPEQLLQLILIPQMVVGNNPKLTTRSQATLTIPKHTQGDLLTNHMLLMKRWITNDQICRSTLRLT